MKFVRNKKQTMLERYGVELYNAVKELRGLQAKAVTEYGDAYAFN